MVKCGNPALNTGRDSVVVYVRKSFSFNIDLNGVYYIVDNPVDGRIGNHKVLDFGRFNQFSVQEYSYFNLHTWNRPFVRF